MNLILRVAAVMSVTALLALTMAVGTAAAAPASVLVNTGIDGADADPGDGICEVTVGNGDCSLRAALMEAQFVSASAEITIDPSVTQLTLSIGGAGEDAGATGDLDISGDVTIIGTWTANGGGGNQVIVPQVSSNSLGDRAIDIGVGARLTLRGVTFWGGGGVGGGDGGTIRNLGALTFDQTGMPADHRWPALGGGTAGRGGNIYNASGAELHAHATVSNSTIELIAGSASIAGGNLFNAGVADLDGTQTGQVYLDDGTAPDGGVIYNAANAGITMRCGVFARFGVATTGVGGGLANWGNASLYGAEVHEGHAGTEGGDLYNAAGATTMLGSCSSVDNLSRLLGGRAPIGANASNHGTLSMSARIVLYDGLATTSGGGLSNDGTVHVMAGTTLEMSLNQAPVGAALDLLGGTWTTSAESQGLFSQNTATADGGIVRVNGGMNQLVNVQVATNTIDGDGSIQVNGGSLELLNSSVTANTTTAAGAGPGLTVTAGAVTVTNTTIAVDSTSAGSGLVRPLGGSTTLSYVTVVAPGELAMKSPATATATLRASLVVGSCSLPGGAITTLGDNVFSTAGCPTTGSDTVSSDAALLDTLGSSGGAVTLTRAPTAGNPAIDHVATSSACPTIVQTYRTRPTDGDDDGTARCDAGAYETSGQTHGGGGGGGGGSGPTGHVHVTVQSALTGTAPDEVVCAAAFDSSGNVHGLGEASPGQATIDATVYVGEVGVVVYPCQNDGDLTPGAAHRPEWYRDTAVNTSAPIPWPTATQVLSVIDGGNISIDVCLDGVDQAVDELGKCTPPTPPPTTPPTTGTIGGRVDGTDGNPTCVAAVAGSNSERTAWALVGADGSFSLTVPPGDYAVVAYRCDPSSGQPVDDTDAVWSGGIAVDSSTLFRAPPGALAVRAGTTVEGIADLRLDIGAAANSRIPRRLAFTGASVTELLLAGFALVSAGAALSRPRRSPARR